MASTIIAMAIQMKVFKIPIMPIWMATLMVMQEIQQWLVQLPEGYVADATDCNDADAAVNPAATEVCNGIDDNCDGNNDEGLTFTTYYADADGDTYGDAGSTVSTCDGAPEGYVSDATDCNDADGAVNPGATEVCNGIDDNCDGNIDEGVQILIMLMLMATLMVMQVQQQWHVQLLKVMYQMQQIVMMQMVL
jgi:hypothetical protein